MRLKYFILGSLFSVILFISINIFIVINRNDYISVKSISGYGKIVTSISNDIDSIKNDTCKDSLTNMLNFINRTHYDKDIKVEDYYNNYFKDKTFIDHFYSVKESCNLEDTDSIYVLALSSTNYPEEIKTRYNLKHEITLRDNSSRLQLLKEQDEVGTYTNKVLELQVIQELVKEAKS